VHSLEVILVVRFSFTTHTTTIIINAVPNEKSTKFFHAVPNEKNEKFFHAVPNEKIKKKFHAVPNEKMFTLFFLPFSYLPPLSHYQLFQSSLSSLLPFSLTYQKGEATNCSPAHRHIILKNEYEKTLISCDDLRWSQKNENQKPKTKKRKLRSRSTDTRFCSKTPASSISSSN
jgi:hypothetical protein